MSDQPPTPRKVLIADDSSTGRHILAGIVRRAGHVPVEAIDGQEALLLARRERPDLALLDVTMPHMDGYQVCAELKEDPELGDVPIVLISGHNKPSDAIKGLELGASDYLIKPFDLEEVAARIRTQLRLRQLTQSLVRLNRELLQKQQRIEEDLKAAADIQRSLIPRGRPSFPGVEVAWRFQPCGTVGGDIFNVHRIDDDHVSAYLLDVSGHGVPPAMVTVSVAQTLSPEAGLVVGNPRRSTSHPAAPPADVLGVLEREYPFERFERFFTISYLVLSTRTGLLRYSSAGHPPPVLLRAQGTLQVLAEGGPPIGLGLPGPYEEGYARLAPGDKLLLYTDGVVEHQAPAGEPFGVPRLHELFKRSGGKPLEAVCDEILRAVDAHGGGRPPEDDISLLALEYRGAPRGERA